MVVIVRIIPITVSIPPKRLVMRKFLFDLSREIDLQLQQVPCTYTSQVPRLFGDEEDEYFIWLFVMHLYEVHTLTNVLY